jgi:hypothetical protein
MIAVPKILLSEADIIANSETCDTLIASALKAHGRTIAGISAPSCKCSRQRGIDGLVSAIDFSYDQAPGYRRLFLHVIDEVSGN